MKKIDKFEIYEISAIAEKAGDKEMQDALLIHNTTEQFKDGDCILFGYNVDDLTTESDVADALQNGNPETDFTVDDNGVYWA